MYPALSRVVLYVNTPTYLGGAEISLLTLMRHLDPACYRPVLVTSGEGQLADAARGYGIETLIQEFPWFARRTPWRYPVSILRLVYAMRKHQVVLVHTNCDHSLGYIRHAARLTHLPYVSHVRDFVRGWFRTPHVEALNRANRVVANSRAVARACSEAGIDLSKIRTIYNPIDLAIFRRHAATQRDEVRLELGIEEDVFVAGIVGQVSPIKGHREFVVAALQVLDHLPDAHFIVCGATNSTDFEAFEDDLRQTVTQSRKSDSFHFLGFRNDIPVVLQALDVLAVPSWSEPFGRVVVEGLAMGCPVIASRAGGIPEIIDDGVTGLLVPPRDPASLAGAMLHLAGDPRLRMQLEIAGPIRAQDFGVQHHVGQVQDLYDEVLRGAGRLS